MAKHYLIFIHGIGELSEKETPADSYQLLWNHIINESGQSRETFEQQFGRIDVVWHVGQLQRAEKKLFEASFPDQKPGWFSPMASLRSFMTFFVGDVAAYVSEDVNFIRRTVLEEIWSYEEGGKPFQQLLEEGATYSIVAHSLGTVIAFDYLFHLFHPDESQCFVPPPNDEKRPEDRQLTQKDEELAQVTLIHRQLLGDAFRHFFSMGSPIALFMMRKGKLWAAGEPFQTVFNPVREKGRVWFNFWDKNDPIAYPLEKLFQMNEAQNAPCKLQDVPVQTWWPVNAHVDYWKNRAIAQKIMTCVRTEA